jgi:putative ABC transport system permease protein
MGAILDWFRRLPPRSIGIAVAQPDTVLGVANDLWFGVRMLVRRPATSIAAIVTLALGIGASTAIFSVVDPVLLRPLPYPEAERLVFVQSTFATMGGAAAGSSLPDYREWRDHNKTLSGLGGWFDTDIGLSSGTGDPEQLTAARVTPNLFPLIGVRPQLGRGFAREEAIYGRHRVALLSHGLWQRRFGGDTDIIGQDVMLDGRPYLVVGVMPAGMTFFGDVPRIELWTPISFPPDDNDPATGEDNMDSRNNYFVNLVGRLRPGVTVAQAQSDIAAIAARVESEMPAPTGIGARVSSASKEITAAVRPSLLLLFGAVALLLLVACVNVANLLLARAVAREREMAVRASIGATRARLFRQVLTESTVLALAGGVVGLFSATWALEVVSALLPASLPRHDAIGLSGRVLLFAFGLSALTVLLFGTLPALQATRGALHERLKQAGGTASDGRRRHLLRSTLVAGEIAFALMLLIGAALLGRSFANLSATDAGFSRDTVAMRIQLSPTSYSKPEQGIAFFAELSDRLRGLPGVEAVGMSSVLPLGFGAGLRKLLLLRDRPTPSSVAEMPAVFFGLVDHDYFRAMGISIRRGRAFLPGEDERAAPVAIINETLARSQFAGRDPVGREVRMCPPASLVPQMDNPCPWRRIVGVVADSKNDSLSKPAESLVVAPYRQFENEGWNGDMTVVLATTTPPADMAAAARAQVRAIDPEQPIDEVATGESLRDRALSLSRFSMVLLAVLSTLAVLLAVVGIYGVLSYLTSQRTHEIGVRMALGARPRDVQLLVLAQGMAMALVGAAAGIAGAFALARFLGSLLYGVDAADLPSYAVVTAAVLLVALLACWIPARRASRVNPIVSLRAE